MAEVLNVCVLPDHWEPPATLTGAIRLSPAGAGWAAWLASSEGGSYDSETAKLAAFAEWGREELFVDVETTETDPLVESIGEEIRNLSIRLGNPFGRVPDDVFIEEIGDWRQRLSRSETKLLLEKTPQGLAQLGTLVLGPLGVLRSVEQRILPPTRDAAGFYCTDLGCTAIHPVQLATGPSEPSKALARLRQQLLDDGRQSSAWGELFRRFTFPESTWFNERFAGKLPALLANGFSDEERQLILIEVLGTSSRIRKGLEEGGCSDVSRSATTTIVERLTPNEGLQALLLEGDNALVESLERLMTNGRIAIPPTEVRRTRFCRAAIARGAFDVAAEASRHGVRLSPRAVGPSSSMRALLRRLYADDDARKDLDWLLRHDKEGELEARLSRFIESGEPRDVVERLVLSAPRRLRDALTLLGPGYFEEPASYEDEQRLLDKILWKLGFDIHGYQEYLPRFHQRLERFQLAVEPSDTPSPEADRDAIRGAGNNFFVSLEEVLDSGLALSAWALLFDHVAVRRSRFHFNLADARTYAFEQINRTGQPAGRPTLDLGGRNTLDPLASAFATLADILEGLPGAEQRFRRAEEELPIWARHSTSESFPFVHTVPWLDLTAESQTTIVDCMRAVPRTLSRNDVANVRNQIAHRRDDFVTGTEVYRVTHALRELVSRLEVAGLVPNVYIREGRHMDRYGRTHAVLRDYRGRELRIAWPSELALTGVPPLVVPQTVITCSVISGTAEHLRFRIDEDSEYRRMWANWPAELHRPVTESDESTDAVESGLSTSVDGGSLEESPAD